jgi:hypothetical protein
MNGKRKHDQDKCSAEFISKDEVGRARLCPSFTVN